MLVKVEFSHFWIAEIDDEADFPEGATELAWASTDGLAGVMEGCAMVLTGTHTGYVDVTVEPSLTEPGGPSPQGYEENGEYDYVSPTGQVAVFDVLKGFPEGRTEQDSIALAGPGLYRLQIFATGREVAAQGAALHEEPVERYLVRMWPVTER